MPQICIGKLCCNSCSIVCVYFVINLSFYFKQKGGSVMEAFMEKKNVEIQAINRQTFSQRLKSYKRSPLSLLLLILVSLSALITVMTLLFLIALYSD